MDPKIQRLHCTAENGSISPLDRTNDLHELMKGNELLKRARLPNVSTSLFDIKMPLLYNYLLEFDAFHTSVTCHVLEAKASKVRKKA